MEKKVVKKGMQGDMGQSPHPLPSHSSLREDKGSR